MRNKELRALVASYPESWVLLLSWHEINKWNSSTSQEARWLKSGIPAVAKL